MKHSNDFQSSCDLFNNHFLPICPERSIDYTTLQLKWPYALSEEPHPSVRGPFPKLVPPMWLDIRLALQLPY